MQIVHSEGEPFTHSITDWEKPLTQEELEEIEAAFDSASSSSSKRRRPSTDVNNQLPLKGRRLPSSLIGCQKSSASGESGSIQSLSSVALLSCPSFRSQNFGPSPYQVARYPTMGFGGRIVYSRTVREVEKATVEIFKAIEAKKRNMNEVTLGFDIEWRPIFKKGVAPRRAAVMQICGDSNHCYVMHIIHSGIPPILQSLLEDPTSMKVGVGIGNDAVKISKDYNVCIKDLKDLSRMASLKLGGLTWRWSLGALCEKLMCKELEKPKKIRLGNWEAEVLSDKQLQYAATDAFTSWYLYQILKTLPDAANNQNEESNGVQP